MLLTGKFREELQDYISQVSDFTLDGPAIYIIMAIIIMLIAYIILGVFVRQNAAKDFNGYVGEGRFGDAAAGVSINMTIENKKAATQTSKLLIALKAAVQVGVLSALIFAALISIKAGQWTGAASARNIAEEKLPRVQILFKKGTSSSAILGLEKHVLRKLFIDKRNIYVFSERDRKDRAIPPIYVISIDEISQIRVLQNEN